MSFETPTPYNEPVLPYSPGSKEKIEVKDELNRQLGACKEIPLCINGNAGSSTETSDVLVPHQKSKVIAKAQNITKEEVSQAIDVCCAAQKEWSLLPWQDRAAVFLKAADLLAGKYRAEMNAATMLGQSKTIHQAEIDAACELADFFRFNARYMEEIQQEGPGSAKTMWNRSEPRGLEGFVYAIAPFNFTSIVVNLAASPAMMGCSVLWKPATTSMHSSEVGMRILTEAGLPDGVINMVHGDPKLISSVALHHPDLAGIHFTGSTPTFNYLWSTVGQNIDKYKTYPRVVGETGGKDFVFAHPSAHVEHLVYSLVRGAFEYQGQKCSAASRAYIPKSIWPQVKEQIVGVTKTLKMGDVSDFTNFMGAVIDDRSFTKIKGYIDHAQSSNDADVICGGTCDDSEGYFVEPTIIEAKVPTYKSMVEEIFGPVLSIYVYDDAKLDETMKICDSSTQYALTGAIFAQDRYSLNHMSQALRNAAGNFYLNDKPTGAVVGQQPFGGSRASGTNDKAGSKLNLLRWTSMRSIKENFVPLTDYKYPFMAES